MNTNINNNNLYKLLKYQLGGNDTNNANNVNDANNDENNLNLLNSYIIQSTKNIIEEEEKDILDETYVNEKDYIEDINKTFLKIIKDENISKIII